MSRTEKLEAAIEQIIKERDQIIASLPSYDLDDPADRIDHNNKVLRAAAYAQIHLSLVAELKDQRLERASDIRTLVDDSVRKERAEAAERIQDALTSAAVGTSERLQAARLTHDIVIDAQGAYWRRYEDGTFSMPPTSTGNEPMRGPLEVYRFSHIEPTERTDG